ALVLWATSRDPEERPQTATALREALAEARASLTPAELDLDESEGPENPAFATRPILVPTATVFEPGADSEPIRTQADTDEIPYLADDERDEAGPEATAAAAGGTVREDSARTAAAASTASAASTAGGESATSAPASAAQRRTGRRGVIIGLVVVLLAALGLGGWAVLGDRSVAVPQYTAGQDPAEYIALLEDAGLSAETVDAHSTTIPSGRL